jgi:hypothetical protein
MDKHIIEIMVSHIQLLLVFVKAVIVNLHLVNFNGVFIGGGFTLLSVSVDVQPIASLVSEDLTKH